MSASGSGIIETEALYAGTACMSGFCPPFHSDTRSLLMQRDSRCCEMAETSRKVAGDRAHQKPSLRSPGAGTAGSASAINSAIAAWAQKSASGEFQSSFVVAALTISTPQPPNMRLPRRVPWATTGEIIELYDYVFSPAADVASKQRGLARVSCLGQYR